MKESMKALLKYHYDFIVFLMQKKALKLSHYEWNSLQFLMSDLDDDLTDAVNDAVYDLEHETGLQVPTFEAFIAKCEFKGLKCYEVVELSDVFDCYAEAAVLLEDFEEDIVKHLMHTSSWELGFTNGIDKERYSAIGYESDRWHIHNYRYDNYQLLVMFDSVLGIIDTKELPI